METADNGNILALGYLRRPIQSRQHGKRRYLARGKITDLPAVKQCFGASAPAKVLEEKFGYRVPAVVAKIKAFLAK